jgi:hypothetical protein
MPKKTIHVKAHTRTVEVKAPKQKAMKPKANPSGRKIIIEKERAPVLYIGKKDRVKY